MIFNKNTSLPVIILLLLASCSDDNDNDSARLDNTLDIIIDENNLNQDLISNRQVVSINSPIAQLGKKLFFTKSLSGDMDTACVSCHHPMLGGGDNLMLPIGVAAEQSDLLGPGRLHDSAAPHFDGGPTVPRNAPTTFNVLLWDKSFFHDGRIESTSNNSLNGNDGLLRTPDTAFNTVDQSAGKSFAQAQARFPVTSPEEMKGFTFQSNGDNQATRDALAARLRGETNELIENNWLEEFRTGLNNPDATPEELITFGNIAKAIAAYENSQLFIDSPWFEYMNGNRNAISEEAKEGALLFFNDYEQGGFNCASCHSGDFFSDEGFHVVATPQIGRGKGDGNFANDDFGRFRETKDENDKYAFRTPSLLNVEVTAPYGHSGSYKTLTEVVKHHLNPAYGIENYDLSQLDTGMQLDDFDLNCQNAVEQLTFLQESNLTNLQNIEISEANEVEIDQKVAQVVAFLETLTDPCVKSRDCLADWLISDGDSDPDGMQVVAFDLNGQAL